MPIIKCQAPQMKSVQQNVKLLVDLSNLQHNFKKITNSTNCSLHIKKNKNYKWSIMANDCDLLLADFFVFSFFFS